MMYDYLIVGAGFAGSVLSQILASQSGKKILLVEKRNHIAGNAYDEYDENQILIHKYGPHIFHTNSEKVFNYLSGFTEWIPYEHKVLAVHRGKLYPVPINIITLNKLYGLKIKTSEEMNLFLDKIKVSKKNILNSEDVIINKVGLDLFEKFFKYYTKKQWDLYPEELSPSVCGRVQVRYNDDCRYFTDKFQFMPKDGYTKMFNKMLNNKKIEVLLNTDYKNILNTVKFDKMIYTGPIDYFFDYKFGNLAYRSIRFEFKNYNTIQLQKSAVYNYVDPDVPYTRVSEFKHMTKQKSSSTTICYEYPDKEGDPYYPIPAVRNKELFSLYKKYSKQFKNIFFCGRLAEYQYYNMDQVVANSFTLLKKILT